MKTWTYILILGLLALQTVSQISLEGAFRNYGQQNSANVRQNVQGAQTVDVAAGFQQFKGKFGKRYSRAEEDYRMAVYAKNAEKIKNNNGKSNKDFEMA